MNSEVARNQDDDVGNEKIKKGNRLNKQSENFERVVQLFWQIALSSSHSNRTTIVVKIDRNGNGIVALRSLKIVDSSKAIITTSISSEIPIERLINSYDTVPMGLTVSRQESLFFAVNRQKCRWGLTVKYFQGISNPTISADLYWILASESLLTGKTSGLFSKNTLSRH